MSWLREVPDWYPEVGISSGNQSLTRCAFIATNLPTYVYLPGICHLRKLAFLSLIWHAPANRLGALFLFELPLSRRMICPTHFPCNLERDTISTETSTQWLKSKIVSWIVFLSSKGCGLFSGQRYRRISSPDLRLRR